MSTKAKRPTYLIRVGMAHKRLFISIALGLVAMLALPAPPITRILIGWDLGVLVYLAAAAVVMTQCSSVAQMKADEFYGTGEHKNGLRFPGGGQPDYWDFIYFSFVIGMTFQVSDVAVMHKLVRRTVVAHGAVSFFFTTAVVAMAVNIAASIIQK